MTKREDEFWYYLRDDVGLSDSECVLVFYLIQKDYFSVDRAIQNFSDFERLYSDYKVRHSSNDEFVLFSGRDKYLVIPNIRSELYYLISMYIETLSEKLKLGRIDDFIHSGFIDYFGYDSLSLDCSIIRDMFIKELYREFMSIEHDDKFFYNIYDRRDEVFWDNSELSDITLTRTVFKNKLKRMSNRELFETWVKLKFIDEDIDIDITDEEPTNPNWIDLYVDKYGARSFEQLFAENISDFITDESKLINFVTRYGGLDLISDDYELGAEDIYGLDYFIIKI